MKNLKKVILVIFTLTFIFSAFKVGKVLAGQEDFKLTGVEIVEKSAYVDADITSFDDDKIITDVTFHKVGNYYTLKISVKNNTDEDYTIETITDNHENQYLSLNYDKHENEKFASKATLNLLVKATYKESVNDKNKREQVNEYKLTIKLIGEDGQEEEKEIPLVPITGDNLALYIILAITSLIVLILTGIYGKKNFKKSMLVLILLLPLIVKAITINVVINVKENLKFYDKVVVTLNRDGDKEERLIDYNTTMTSPTANEKEGHSFKGWSKDNELYDFSKSFTEDTELVATYEKNKYNVSYEYFDDSVNKTVTLPSTSEKEYASNVTVENGLELAGYTFDGWYKDSEKVTNFTMPASAVVLKGRLTPNTNTAYKVEYYYQEAGVYGTPKQSITRFGTTDTNVDVQEVDKVPQLEGYVLDDSNTGKVYSGTIAGDGSLTLKVYFKQQFTVTFKPGTHGTFTESTVEDLDYNSDTPAVPTVTGEEGYNHVGWEPEIASKVTGNAIYTAKWEAGTVAYNTEYYWQNTNDDNYTLHETVPGTGTTDAPVNAEIKTYPGFSHDENNANKLETSTIAGDGSLVLKVYYNRNVHTVSYQYLGNAPTSAPAAPQGGNYKYGATVSIASNPELAGYTFSGWSRTENFEMPDENILITGSWTANGNTAYKVEHWTEKLDGTYELLNGNTENLTGETDTEATANPKTIPGFSYDASNTNNVKTGNISGTGDLVLKLYYARESYQVSYEYYDDSDNKSVTLPTASNKKYEDNVTVANGLELAGYTFDGWYRGNDKVTSFTMPYEDVVLKGRLTANTDTAYKVEYYYQVNGSYEVTPTEVTRYGTTNTEVSVTENDKVPQQTGYVVDPNKVSEYSGNINGNGSLVLRVYFKQQFSVTYNPGTHGTFNETTIENLDYNSDTPANPTITGEDGYTFSNWNPQITPKVTQNVTYVAEWTADINTAYKTEYYWQNIEDDNYTIHETINGSGTTDAPVNAVINTYTGFTHDEENANKLETSTIAGDGSLVLKVYYNRNKYDVTYSYTDPKPSDATTLPATASYRYGAEVTVAPLATGTGYTFNGWTLSETVTDGKFTMPANAVAITGSWTVHTNTVTYSVSGDVPTGYTVPTVTDPVAYGEEVEVAPVPTRDGYIFTGWKKGNDIVTSFTMPDESVTLTGVWSVNTDTAYKTEYYWQNIENDNYTIHETINGSGTTDAPVNAVINTYTGFTHDENNANKLETSTIAGDGSLVLKVYYNRNKYDVTYSYTDPKPSDATALPTTVSYKYGKEVTLAPLATGTGYTFNGWTLSETVTDGKFTMPANAVAITGSWTVHTNTVTYSVSGDVPNGYTVPTVTDPVAYGTNVTVANVPEIEGYDFDGWYRENDKVTSFTMPDESVTLTGVWTVHKYNITYTVTGDIPEGFTTPDGQNNVAYGTNINVPTVTAVPGYEFSGWTSENVTITNNQFAMPNNNVVVTGTWTALNVNYKVQTYLEENGNYNVTPTEVTRQAKTGTEVSVTDADKTAPTGYVLDNTMTSDYTGTVAGDGSLVLKVYFKQQLSVTYQPGDHGTFTETTTNNLSYGATTPTAPDVENDHDAGYHFTAWTPTWASTVTSTVTYVAGWAPNEDTAYTVEFYYQVDGAYPQTATLTNNRQGITDTEISVTNEDKTPASPYALQGYVLDDNASEKVYSGTIAGNGSLVLKVYFKQQFTVTYQPGDKGTFTETTTNNLDYGSLTPTEPDVTNDHAAGYHFTGWNPARENTVTSNKVYVAEWAPNTNTPYVIEYYLETLNDGYVKDDSLTDHLTGTTDTTASTPTTPKAIANHKYDATNTNNVTSGTIAGDGSLVLKLYYKLNVYTITFNSTTGHTYNGDDVIEDVVITKRHGEQLALSELPNKPTYVLETLKQNPGVAVNKQHNALLGWYTEDTSGTKITEPVTITEDKTYFAHWDPVPITCKKATTLHTATCSGNESGCVKEHRYTTEGLMQTTTIVYGETSASTTPVISDAYDCDVNNDQIYDSTYERFYYLGDDGDNAIMIYYSNWDGEKRDTTQNFPYSDALTRLPNSNHTEWYNVENPTRFLTFDEALALCDERPNGQKYTFTGCEYLLEQSGFEQDVPDSNNVYHVRSGIWLEKVGDVEWRIHTRTLDIDHESKKNAVKPVVLIPKTEIENRVLDTYTVTYNSMGGNIGTDGHITTVTIPAGSAIRIPPTPTKNGNTFAGWYTTENYDTKISLPVIVNENKTYYAKWTSASGNAARIGDVEYFTLQDAIDDVKANGASATTIQLIKDITEDIVIDNNKNILLNMLGHTITNNSNNGHVITVNSGSSLSMFNGTVTTNSSKEMINNAGTLEITGGTYNATGTGGGITNTGSLRMRNSYTITTASSTNPTILNNGTLQISDGTIKSTGTYAIYNESGTFQVGEIGNSTLDVPVIQGNTYGIVSKVNYKLYDGVIKGRTYPIGKAEGDTPTITSDPDKTMIIEQDDQVIYIHGSETQGEALYQTLYMRYWDKVFAVTFDNGEEATPSKQVMTITRGNALGALPSEPTRYGYIFRGWYKTTDYNEADRITATTVPTAPDNLEPADHDTAYVTYYAKWEENTADIHMVTLNAGSGSFESNNSSTLTFQVHGESPLSAFPEEPVNSNSYLELAGWYYEPTFDTAVTFPLTIDDDITFYAKWDNTSIAKIDGEYCNCSTLTSAINLAPKNATTQTRIELLKNTTDNLQIKENRNILLDLGGYRVVNASGSGPNSRVVQVLGGKLEVINGTLRQDTSENVIYVNSSSELTIGEDAVVFHNKDKQAIMNDGGTVTIKDNGVVRALHNVSNTPRATIQNYNNGTLNILGGEVISDKAYAIFNQNGTVIIGTEDGTIDSTSPVIQGKTYGIITKAPSTIKFYDGIIKGTTYPLVSTTSTNEYNPETNTITNDTERITIEEKQEPSVYQIGNETIGSDVYQTLYLEEASSLYALSFNPGAAGNNATLSFDSLNITRGDPIGMLPTASWDASHEFDGWYTELTGGTKVTIETVPTGDNGTITYYAHWNEITPETYTISFNANGGTGTMADVTDLSGTYTLPENEFTAPTDKRFKGWSLTSTGETITEVVMNEDKEVYAIWEDIPDMICRKATTLEQEACNAASGKGCKAANTGDPIVYGVNTGTLRAGYALDCKLTTTGDYDTRFYYLKSDNDNAVLLSHGRLSEATAGTIITTGNTDQLTHAQAIAALPTASQWDNIPVTFTINNVEKAARLATVDDIKTACGVTNTSSTGALDSCYYVMSNLNGFTGNTTGRSFYWLDETNGIYYRLGGSDRLIASKENSSQNSAKAVIEVPLDQIDLNYTVEIPKAYTTSQAIREYFDNVDELETQFNSDNDQTAYINQLKTIFTSNSCSYCGSSVNDQSVNNCNSPSSIEGANKYCDQPDGYDTGVNGNVNVYKYENNTKGDLVTYTTSSNGIIYNMIPGEKYYWESASDSSVNGVIEAEGERRVLKSNVRNLRDLGGMAVSYTDGSVTKTGTIKYQKLYRGAQITSAEGVTELNKLGITREIDLRENGDGTQTYKLDNYDIGTKNSYTDIVITNYHINPVATEFLPTEATASDTCPQYTKHTHAENYENLKNAMKIVMQDIIDGESIYFHCTIGTDRTGTIAYFLEGLLGVSEMDRLRDYELSYYYGLTNRSRFHDNLSGSKVNPRFTSMYKSYPTNQDIYNFFTYGDTAEEKAADDALIARFRQAMIDFN